MKKNLKFIILGICMIGLILGYFYYVSNRSSVDEVEEKTTKVSSVQRLINRNLVNNYPPTPKEVMKLYADITVAFYTEDYTDDELSALALKLRDLYDEDLNNANPTDEYLRSIRNEITSFKSQGVAFSSYNTAAAPDVIYFKKDGREVASIDVTFTMKQGTQVGLTKETFILRKDSLGHWKIFGWTLAKED